MEAQDRYLSKQALYELTSFHDAMEDVFDVHFARHGLSSAKFKALIHLYMTGDRGFIIDPVGIRYKDAGFQG
jgi:MarR family 2-MHQ and catechol resistance regulon transcriptional repressor